MDVRLIISLFGYSEESPEIKSIFKQLQIITKPKMEIGDRTYKKKKSGIELSFFSRYNFESQYGLPKERYTDSPEECFLRSISLGGYDQNSVFDFALPMGLLFKDKPDAVIEKLGVKVKEQGETSYGEYREFRLNEHCWIVGFNKKQELIGVHIWLVDKQERQLIEMKRVLKGQDKHITSTNEDELSALKNNLPTLKWRKRMKQGDSLFNENNIETLEITLHAFIDDLLLGITKKKGAPVYAAVKRLVLQVNKLNIRFDGFIETTEREELVSFIEKAVNFTGFRTEKDFDITEAFREW